MQYLLCSVREYIQTALHKLSLAAFLIDRLQSVRFVVDESGLNLQWIRSLAEGSEIGVQVVEHR